MKLSERLKQAAALVSEGNMLADVGTDHGYVPIYLIEHKKIPAAIAMDINQGPLDRAREHIAQHGMETYIKTRLSDGVAALKQGEADSILIAGMGGGLVMHILHEGKEICQSAKELILQPQSELEKVRRFLDENGYVTETEEMVKEDGKYYPMMRVHYNEGMRVQNTPIAYMYGANLLEQRHPVLLDFLQKEREIYKEILSNLTAQPQTEKIKNRKTEVEMGLVYNNEALDYYKRGLL